MAFRKLDASQEATFDQEYVDDALWERTRPAIVPRLPASPRILDVGGGNGQFMDRMLASFPGATGVVLDVSGELLKRNQPGERKRLVQGSAQQLSELFEPASFDLVCFNWVLHHFVGDSFGETRAMQLQALRSAARLLAPRGVVSVFENGYSGWSLLPSPGRTIYEITRSRLAAPFARFAGANTAATGVAFASDVEWKSWFERAGLEVLSERTVRRWNVTLKRALLNAPHVRVVHYVLGRA